MPTGYTAIIEDRDVTFEEFVWRCARAFGAFVMLRDDPLDAPVPERFEPSDYYDRELTTAKQRVKQLEGLTSSERTAEGARLRAESIASSERYLERERAVNARYDAMSAKVAAWAPPSNEHVGLKDFMLEQLRISRNGTEYTEKSLAQARTKAAGEFFADALSEARRRVTYLAEEREKEIERTEGRNRWIAQLRQSVNPPERETETATSPK